VIEAVQSGFQGNKLTWMVLGNIVTYLVRRFQGLADDRRVILATTARGWLTIGLSFFKRAHLAPRLSLFSWRDSRPLIFRGAFS
jgi:hypothetical protein